MRHEQSFYTEVLDHYFATGEFLETGSSEPLYTYLRSILENPIIKVQALSDEVCARVLYDTLSQFILQNLEREKYNYQRKQSEEKSRQLITQWTHDRKRDGWQALVEELDCQYDDTVSTPLSTGRHSVKKGRRTTISYGKSWPKTGRKPYNVN